ncbi:hypothetical protein [Bauldia litoralis]|uniref:hypothetical protein n=1 Tax=Bauldia litoralis TaxID=665467 RepID=UPI003267972D
MTETLDRSRSFGTVNPPMDGKVFYEQDGNLFDKDDNRIYREGEKPDPMAKARAAKAAKKAQTGNPDVDAIYSKPPWRRFTPKPTFTKDEDGKRGRKYPRSHRVVGKPTPAMRPKTADVKKPTGPNLSAWARGEEKALFGEIKGAIRERFNIVVNQEHDAHAVLIQEGVVGAGDIPGYTDTGASISGE